MLKIAEYNKKTGKKIEVEELEKYGFEYQRMVWIKEIIRGEDDILESKSIYVTENDRELSIRNGLFNVDEELDTLYDLITDGYIEKVKNEK